MFKRILCAVDGSDHARKAQALAIDLAGLYKAELIFQHVMLIHAAAEELERFARIEGLSPALLPQVDHLRSAQGRLEYGYHEPPEGSRVYAELGQTLLDEAKEAAREAGVTQVETLLSDRDPAERILHAAREREVDCILLGSRGLSDTRALFLGSVSHKVVNRAPCTCIAVK
jgi:nucleotide-binding universal stress UspA family protein